eukprot:1149780-Pelagomonas_calceolata.AAC.4
MQQPPAAIAATAAAQVQPLERNRWERCRRLPPKGGTLEPKLDTAIRVESQKQSCHCLAAMHPAMLENKEEREAGS